VQGYIGKGTRPHRRLVNVLSKLMEALLHVLRNVAIVAERVERRT
jgi:hypothetical protein